MNSTGGASVSLTCCSCHTNYVCFSCYTNLYMLDLASRTPSLFQAPPLHRAPLQAPLYYKNYVCCSCYTSLYVFYLAPNTQSLLRGHYPCRAALQAPRNIQIMYAVPVKQTCMCFIYLQTLKACSEAIPPVGPPCRPLVTYKLCMLFLLHKLVRVLSSSKHSKPAQRPYPL